MERYEKAVILERTKGPFNIAEHKRFLIEKNKHICPKCGKQQSKGNFAINHKIPVKVIGPTGIWDKGNLWILCRLCDKEKLNKDFKIIKEMREKGFYTNDEGFHVFLKPERECYEYYIKRREEI